MSNPLVSILMNCYNSEKFLKETLASVWGQTYGNWQLVFVDNHSTDQSNRILEDHAQGDERLVLIKTPVHMPLGEAREYGLQFCMGDYIAFLDTDDIWLPEKLEKQLNAFQDNPEASICYTSAIWINEKGNAFSKKMVRARSGDLFGDNLASYEVNFQTAMISASVLGIIDPPFFDPNLSYSPDHDLIMRVLVVGEAVSLYEPLVRYRFRAGSLSEKTMHLWARESAYTFRKLKKAGYLAKKSSKKQQLKALGQISVERAKFLVIKGETRRAKSVLRRFRFVKVKNFLFWLACFLPFCPTLYRAREENFQKK